MSAAKKCVHYKKFMSITNILSCGSQPPKCKRFMACELSYRREHCKGKCEKYEEKDNGGAK